MTLSLSAFLLLCGCTSSDTPNPRVVLDSLALAQDARIRAGQFYESDRLDSALFWYTRATQYNPNDKHAWHGKASTLGRMGRQEESMPAFAQALRIDSNYVLAIWHRACANANILHKDEALADLRRAIALDSTVKQGAQEDSCFEWLWEDKDFLTVVK